MELDHLQWVGELDLGLAPEQFLALVDRDAGDRGRERAAAVLAGRTEAEDVSDGGRASAKTAPPAD